MSEVKVNKISPRTNCGTVQLGDSGDTITIPAGATITNNGTQTGFGRTGAVDWDTTAKTASFTAVSGNGYFINSAGGAVTVTLPASPSAGDIVGIADYNNTAETNFITINRNGSNINGTAGNVTMTTNKSAVVLVYVDATSGWANVSTASPDDITSPFITATGGTITCSGDFKIHTFTSPGTFTVTNAGTPSGSTTVSYTVVGAGGGGGSATGSSRSAAGGGAGGFRESRAVGDTYTASPLNATSGPTYNLPVSAQAYPITVSGGGAGGTTPGNKGTSGGTSVFSTITSAGGGGGGGRAGGCSQVGGDGGSGGGGVDNAGAGTGNTPPVSPPQGQPGGNPPAGPNCSSGSGGGAGAAGQGKEGPQLPGVAGGAGVTNCITASPVTRAGGGGSGGGGDTASSTGGSGGSGGGGNGGPRGTIGGNATDNTGGGGGGSGANPGKAGGNGGSGVVIIRYKYQ